MNKPDARVQAAFKACDRFVNGDPEKTLPEVYAALASYAEKHKIEPDFYGSGTFLQAFEKEIAELLGMEAGLFMPSGTMAQLIAARIWCDRAGSKEVAFHPACHLEQHEFHAYRELHGLHATLVGEESKTVYPKDLENLQAAFLLLELPQRRSGCLLPSWEDLEEMKKIARKKNIRLHMDGARLWESQSFYGRSLKDICAGFDSVYVSFYKGINALTGAMLLGPADFIEESRTWLRRHGGNLYHMHPFVVSAKMNLENRHLLAGYAERARGIAAAIQRGYPGAVILPAVPQTNYFHFHSPLSVEKMRQFRLEMAEEEKIWVSGMFGESYLLEGGSYIEFRIGANASRVSDQEIEEMFRRLS